MAEPRDPTKDDADYRLWLRIRYAASAAGYSGVREMAESMNVEGMSYGNLLRLPREREPILTPHETIADAISEHCRERGAHVPAEWLLHGWDNGVDHLGQIRDLRRNEVAVQAQARSATAEVRDAVIAALQGPAQPSDAELLEATGWTAEQLAEVQAELREDPSS